MKKALWSGGAVLAVALSVFGVALANRKVYPSYASAAAANADTSSSAGAASQVQGSSASASAPAVAARASRSGEGESENESEDEAEGGGYVPRKTASAPAAPKSSTQSTASTASAYKDGTYEAVGTYDSPGGSDSLDVTLTIKNGVVTGASVTPMPNDNTSARYQDMFISGYKSQVIGKQLATLNLDYVSGSSLTPIGFDNAVAAIKAKAKA